MDLSTRYMGFTLSSPIMPGACPLPARLDNVRRLEDAGAPLIVLPSLFEEQLMNEQFREVQDVEAAEDTYYEALTYHARRDEYQSRGVSSELYLEMVRRTKEAVSVPVLASLNGVTPGDWMQRASACVEAGADGLELNFYFVATKPDLSGAMVESRAVGILRAVKERVRVPVAVKLSPFFSSLPDVVRQLEENGADAVVIFNRFYEPDIDVEKLEHTPVLSLSDPSELLLRLRWASILSGGMKSSLGITGGVHGAVDAVKALMAGAHGVQMVSALFRHGTGHLRTVREELARWLERHGYESLAQLRGSMNLERTPDPQALVRGNYMRILQGGVKYV